MSREYDEYLENHTTGVLQAYQALVDLDVVYYDSDIVQQLNRHDDSKRDAEEYDVYDEYFYSYEESNRPQRVEHEFLYAFLHHLHNNPHHWQHWVLIQDSGENSKEEVLDMPYNYMLEMICDWWSFSWMKFNESQDKEDLYSIFSWYEDNKDDIKLSDSTREAVEDLLERLRQNLTKYDVTDLL